MPFRIFRLRTLTGANVVGLLVGASLFSMFFFISLYMQQVLGYSPIKSGFSYLPLALTIILSAGIASQLVTRLGFKPVLLTGLAFIAAGLIWFCQVSVGGGYVSDVLGPSLLAAVGLGFSFVPVTIAAVAGVEEREAGLASGLINTSQQIGGALGLAVLATVANSRTDDLMAQGGGPAALPNALTEGFQAAFLTGAGFAVLGIVLGALLIRGSDSRAHAASGTPARQRQVPSAVRHKPRAAALPAAVRLNSSSRRPPRGGLRVGEEPDPATFAARMSHSQAPGESTDDPARAAPQAHRGLHEHAAGPQLAHLLERELEFRPVLAHVVQPAPQALVAAVDGPVQDRPQRHQLHIRDRAWPPCRPHRRGSAPRRPPGWFPRLLRT